MKEHRDFDDAPLLSRAQPTSFTKEEAIIMTFQALILDFSPKGKGKIKIHVEKFNK